MDRTIIHSLIEQIVAEVVRRVEAELLREQHPERVAVLVCGKPTAPDKMAEWLQGRFGSAYTLLCGGKPPEERDAEAVTKAVGEAETLILAAPDIGQLRSIAAGETPDAVSAAAVRALLWKKRVTVLLDYEPPRFRRNTFFETVAGALETLKSMGVCVEYYEAFEPITPGKDLITEADIRQAAETGQKTVSCAYGAIITPSAKDAIRETGVLLEYRGGSQCN